MNYRHHRLLLHHIILYSASY